MITNQCKKKWSATEMAKICHILKFKSMRPNLGVKQQKIGHGCVKIKWHSMDFVPKKNTDRRGYMGLWRKINSKNDEKYSKFYMTRHTDNNEWRRYFFKNETIACIPVMIFASFSAKSPQIVIGESMAL